MKGEGEGIDDYSLAVFNQVSEQTICNLCLGSAWILIAHDLEKKEEQNREIEK